MAARELAFARKAAAAGDFRLALSLFQRLVDHDPRNRRLREEMDYVAARAPAEIRARYVRARDERPPAATPSARKPLLARTPDAPAAPASPRAAPEARIAEPQKVAATRMPASAPETPVASAATRAPNSGAEPRSPRLAEADHGGAKLAKIAVPSSSTPLSRSDLRAPAEVASPALLDPPVARAKHKEARPKTANLAESVPDRRLDLRVPGEVAAPKALAPALADAARGDAARGDAARGDAARGDARLPRIAAASAPTADRPLDLRAPAEIAAPKVLAPVPADAERRDAGAPRMAAPALPLPRRDTAAPMRRAAASAALPPLPQPAPERESEVATASPHANDAPRPANEQAARTDVATDVIAQAAPDPRPRDDVDRLFDALMRDPGNVELNLRYARAVADKGEPRKALPAYERVLAIDPTNAEAAAGLARVQAALEPDITQVTLSIGAFYESNPRHFRNHSSHTDAGTLSGRATLFDERRIRGVRWRTEGETFFSWHTRFHDIDYGLFTLRGGPVFRISENLRVNPFIGGGYAWLKGRSFYLEVAGGATFEFDKLLPLHSVGVRAGYNDIGQHISTRESVFVEVAPRFLFPNVGYQGTALWLNPYWRYNGVVGSGAPGFDQRTEPFPARAHQLGVRIDYFLPVTSKLTLGVNAGYEYRHFFEPVSDGSKQRRDHFVSPGAQAIVTGLIDDRFGIIFLYAYEHRFSNDGPQIYSNHLGGVRLLWRN